MASTIVMLANSQGKSPAQVVADALNSSENKGEAAVKLKIHRTSIKSVMERYGVVTRYVVVPKTAQDG